MSVNPTRAPLPDQAARDRFRDAFETNFSVIAPAGVGKTTSIVERVLAIAEADRLRPSDPLLPRLVVVTYTKKAADEMIARVRHRLEQSLPHPGVHAHLAQAFFGTIHSFCQRLLTLAGPLVGIPGEAEIATDREALWTRYRREQPSPSILLPPDLARAFSLHGEWSDVFALAAEWPVDVAHSSSPQALPSIPPMVDGSEILAVEAKGNGRANILLAQSNFRRWQERVAAQRGEERPLPCPEPEFPGGGAKIKDAWEATFRPLRNWRRVVTGYLAREVAADYARYRRRQGQLTFDDIILLAKRLLQHPESRDLLRGRHWRIILDEAQDTDPDQFTVLTELARPPGADGDWILGESDDGPRPGHFSMVGDMQQSIYSERADLARYQQVHQRLLACGGEQAVFSVTMRCPVSVVNFLNATFPSILRSNGPGSRQVSYVTLENPEGAEVGQVVRILPSPPSSDLAAQAGARLAGFAREFARWLKGCAPEDFGAREWSDVAVLCPRNKWLERLAGALELEGVPVQRASRRATKGEDPVHAWFTAVLGVFARPRDSFELYGVLRDILGFSDDALTRFIRGRLASGEPDALRFDRAPAEIAGPVAEVLAALHQLLGEVRQRPLFEAVDLLLGHFSLEERLVESGLAARSAASETLAKLRSATAQAEADQLTLLAWADQCRRGLLETIDEAPPQENAVVLLTAHKSKGLGFRAVILPAFFRDIGNVTPNYPRAERSPGGTVELLLSNADVDDEAKLRTERRRRELNERLLYVALTRVKHSLILFDDAAWWEGLRRSGDPGFGTTLLGDLESSNGAPWEALPETLQRWEPTEAAPPAAAPLEPWPTPPSAETPLPPFWRRVTPSSLQVHDPSTWANHRDEPDRLLHPEFPEEARPLDPAAYGNWWHDTMEHAPWNDSDALELLRLHTQKALEKCPPEQRSRGAREIASFLGSSLAAKLCSPEWTVWTEVPFLARDSQDTALIGYEGYIDLVARHADSGEWLVVDWKTDRLAVDDPSAALLTAYGPQLAVYARAMEDAFESAGQSGLYNTVTAAWVPLGSTN
jgi:ATP-dependent exoDNAse (exonuclease V) beta subunit